MTPADEMRAAVKLLRETAEDTTRGPWWYYSGSERNDYDKAEVVAERGGWVIAKSRHAEDADLRWIAIMCPALAESLALLLEESAHLARFAYVMEAEHASEKSLSVVDRRVLDLARSILASATPEDTNG